MGARKGRWDENSDGSAELPGQCACGPRQRLKEVFRVLHLCALLHHTRRRSSQFSTTSAHTWRQWVPVPAHTFTRTWLLLMCWAFNFKNQWKQDDLWPWFSWKPHSHLQVYCTCEGLTVWSLACIFSPRCCGSPELHWDSRHFSQSQLERSQWEERCSDGWVINKEVFLWLSGRALRQQHKRLWVQFPGNTHTVLIVNLVALDKKNYVKCKYICNGKYICSIDAFWKI